MAKVAPGVHLLSELPRRYLNAYVVDGVLVDAGTRWWGRRLRRRLADHDVHAHLLTHADPDHRGMSAAVREWLDVPVWCHEAERPVVEGTTVSPPAPRTLAMGLFEATLPGPDVPVAGTVTEGDAVGSFEVLETPGNAPGHVSLWRESDGTVILGDVLLNIDLFTGRLGLREAPERVTWDPAAAVESARRVRNLDPETVCFGHGPPVTDGRRFSAFVAELD